MTAGKPEIRRRLAWILLNHIDRSAWLPKSNELEVVRRDIASVAAGLDLRHPEDLPLAEAADLDAAIERILTEGSPS